MNTYKDICIVVALAGFVGTGCSAVASGLVSSSGTAAYNAAAAGSAKSDEERVATYGDDLTCEQAVPRYEEYMGTLGDDSHKAQKQLWLSAGVKIIECGDFKYAYEAIIHVGQHPKDIGYQVLDASARGGVDIEDALITYHRQFKNETGRANSAAVQAMTWLLDNNKTSRCGELVPTLVDTSPAVSRPYLHYMAEAKCQAAADAAAALLAHDDPGVRANACHTLGDLGATQYVSQMQMASAQSALH
ncbi:MAG: hypothetical protein AAGC55_27645 [Myxococcota bacterium]